MSDHDAARDMRAGLVGKVFPVLDDGHVILIDAMGDDGAIVDAARVSYGAGTRRASGDGDLIRYLMRHRHMTPFEMCEIKLRVRVPMDCWRQWIRHRTANVNEYSTRYSEAIDAMYATAPDAWRAQATDNKQGSGAGPIAWPSGEIADACMDTFGPAATAGQYLSVREDALHDLARVVYRERLNAGVAREQARKDLPLSTYCYDASTEVLTDRGFVAWPDVRHDDKIGIWDGPAGTLCYEVPEYLTRDYYKGEMYRVDHRGVDLLVTPNHKMWVDRGHGFELVPAAELGDRTLVRYTKLAPFIGQGDWAGDGTSDDPRALLSLMGFFIGDGNAPKSGDKNAIIFSLRRPRKIEYLAAICKEVGWPCEKRGPHYVVRADMVTDRFRELFYDQEGRKKVPPFLRKLNADDSSAILEGFLNSDGCRRSATGAFRYDSTSEQVCQSVAIIAVHAGLAVNVVNPTLRQPPHSDLHHVQLFAPRSANPVVNQMNRNTSFQQYDGYVYCAKTRTGIMVVRRNGKVVLSGNTEAYWKCDLRNVLGFLALRMDGHAQEEIREYADVIGREIVAKLFPATWEAFREYVLGSMTLNLREINLIIDLMRGRPGRGREGEAEMIAGAMPAFFANRRERDECRAKLVRLGLIPRGGERP